MKNKGDKVMATIGVVMVAGIFAIYFSIASGNCDGTLVRGVFGFECIKGLSR